MESLAETTERGSKTGTVLVVDDDEKNRELVRSVLELDGHTVEEATNGAEALTKVLSCGADVVVLDVMMPGLSGFDVCRTLKDNPETAAIPVLLVTALRDRKDRIRGIDAGATDFLTKPIDSTEVALHVRNAVLTKRLFDQVRESYQRLRELEIRRDTLTHMIVHDLRTPLTAILVSLELLKNGGSQLDETQREDIAVAIQSAQQLMEMVNSVLDVSRMEAGEMPVSVVMGDLKTTISEAVGRLGWLARGRDLEPRGEEGPLVARHDPELVRRITINLLANALNVAADDDEVEVLLSRSTDRVRVSVRDTARGIPEEHRERIFEKFGQIERDGGRTRYSTGLGLTFCKLAVEAQGGTMGIESQVGVGSTFWFELPVAGMG